MNWKARKFLKSAPKERPAHPCPDCGRETEFIRWENLVSDIDHNPDEPSVQVRQCTTCGNPARF